MIDGTRHFSHEQTCSTVLNEYPRSTFTRGHFLESIEILFPADRPGVFPILASMLIHEDALLSRSLARRGVFRTARRSPRSRKKEITRSRDCCANRRACWDNETGTKPPHNRRFSFVCSQSLLPAQSEISQCSEFLLRLVGSG